LLKDFFANDLNDPFQIVGDKFLEKQGCESSLLVNQAV